MPILVYNLYPAIRIECIFFPNEWLTQFRETVLSLISQAILFIYEGLDLCKTLKFEIFILFLRFAK